MLKLPGVKQCTDVKFQHRFVLKFPTVVGMYTGPLGCDALYNGSCAQIIPKNLRSFLLGYFL